MIQLSLSDAFIVYLGITLTALISLWIFQSYRLRSKQLIPYEKGLNVCEYCQHPYLDEEYKAVTRCPQCHSFNKIDEKKIRHRNRHRNSKMV